jgi:nucleotide-binding universal stress UspA family protein
MARVLLEAERVDTVEQRFREELPLRALDGEWHMLDHTDLAELIQLAKSADLAILGQYPGNEPDGVALLRPDDVMIDTGRPVLVVPYAGTFERVGRRVLVAWDGTREANRALHDALPLIAAAEAVTVMHVGAQQADLDRDRPWLERIVSHLGRHGIKAQAEESLRGGISISDVLLSRAADLGVDMIVAGAYHHSQARETLLGGVSAHEAAEFAGIMSQTHLFWFRPHIERGMSARPAQSRNSADCHSRSKPRALARAHRTCRWAQDGFHL